MPAEIPLAIALTAAGTATSVYGQVKAGNAAKKVGQSQQQAAELQAQQDEYNAGNADKQAADTYARGVTDEGRFRSSVRTLIGSQRAGFAGQGVDVSTGSSRDVTQDAEYLGNLDALTIRQNAQRAAWGYGVQADNYRRNAAVSRQSGQIALQAGNNAQDASYIGAASTILGTGSSLLLQRYGWQQ